METERIVSPQWSPCPPEEETNDNDDDDNNNTGQADSDCSSLWLNRTSHPDEFRGFVWKGVATASILVPVSPLPLDDSTVRTSSSTSTTTTTTTTTTRPFLVALWLIHHPPNHTTSTGGPFARLLTRRQLVHVPQRTKPVWGSTLAESGRPIASSSSSSSSSSSLTTRAVTKVHVTARVSWKDLQRPDPPSEPGSGPTTVPLVSWWRTWMLGATVAVLWLVVTARAPSLPTHQRANEEMSMSSPQQQQEQQPQEHRAANGNVQLELERYDHDSAAIEFDPDGDGDDDNETPPHSLADQSLSSPLPEEYDDDDGDDDDNEEEENEMDPLLHLFPDDHDDNVAVWPPQHASSSPISSSSSSSSSTEHPIERPPTMLRRVVQPNYECSFEQALLHAVVDQGEKEEQDHRRGGGGRTEHRPPMAVVCISAQHEPEESVVGAFEVGQEGHCVETVLNTGSFTAAERQPQQTRLPRLMKAPGHSQSPIVDEQTVIDEAGAENGLMKHMDVSIRRLHGETEAVMEPEAMAPREETGRFNELAHGMVVSSSQDTVQALSQASSGCQQLKIELQACEQESTERDSAKETGAENAHLESNSRAARDTTPTPAILSEAKQALVTASTTAAARLMKRSDASLNSSTPASQRHVLEKQELKVAAGDEAAGQDESIRKRLSFDSSHSNEQQAKAAPIQPEADGDFHVGEASSEREGHRSQCQEDVSKKMTDIGEINARNPTPPPPDQQLASMVPFPFGNDTATQEERADSIERQTDKEVDVDAALDILEQPATDDTLVLIAALDRSISHNRNDLCEENTLNVSLGETHDQVVLTQSERARSTKVRERSIGHEAGTPEPCIDGVRNEKATDYSVNAAEADRRLTPPLGACPADSHIRSSQEEETDIVGTCACHGRSESLRHFDTEERGDFGRIHKQQNKETHRNSAETQARNGEEHALKPAPSNLDVLDDQKLQLSNCKNGQAVSEDNPVHIFSQLAKVTDSSSAESDNCGSSSLSCGVRGKCTPCQAQASPELKVQGPDEWKVAPNDEHDFADSCSNFVLHALSSAECADVPVTTEPPGAQPLAARHVPDDENYRLDKYSTLCQFSEKNNVEGPASSVRLYSVSVEPKRSPFRVLTDFENLLHGKGSLCVKKPLTSPVKERVVEMKSPSKLLDRAECADNPQHNTVSKVAERSTQKPFPEEVDRREEDNGVHASLNDQKNVPSSPKPDEMPDNSSPEIHRNDIAQKTHDGNECSDRIVKISAEQEAAGRRQTKSLRKRRGLKRDRQTFESSEVAGTHQHIDLTCLDFEESGTKSDRNWLSRLAAFKNVSTKDNRDDPSCLDFEVGSVGADVWNPLLTTNGNWLARLADIGAKCTTEPIPSFENRKMTSQNDGELGQPTHPGNIKNTLDHSTDLSDASTLTPHSDSSLDRPDLGRPRRDDERINICNTEDRRGEHCATGHHCSKETKELLEGKSKGGCTERTERLPDQSEASSELVKASRITDKSEGTCLPCLDLQPVLGDRPELSSSKEEIPLSEFNSCEPEPTTGAFTSGDPESTLQVTKAQNSPMTGERQSKVVVQETVALCKETVTRTRSASESEPNLEDDIIVCEVRAPVCQVDKILPDILPSALLALNAEEMNDTIFDSKSRARARKRRKRGIPKPDTSQLPSEILILADTKVDQPEKLTVKALESFQQIAENSFVSKKLNVGMAGDNSFPSSTNEEDSDHLLTGQPIPDGTPPMPTSNRTTGQYVAPHLDLILPDILPSATLVSNADALFDLDFSLNHSKTSTQDVRARRRRRTGVPKSVTVSSNSTSASSKSDRRTDTASSSMANANSWQRSKQSRSKRARNEPNTNDSENQSTQDSMLAVWSAPQACVAPKRQRTFGSRSKND